MSQRLCFRRWLGLTAFRYGDGPLTVGIPDFQYPDVNDYFAAFKGVGAHRPLDGNNGEAYGASWYPQTFDPRTGKRTHARNAYYDPITNRANLEVKLHTMADELAFQKRGFGLKVSGVKITDRVTGEKQTVYARREVVLAAGAVNTPKLLQLSGIGPRSVLEAAGIKVRLAHDGVGANFQDHPYTLMTYSISNMSKPNPTSLTTDSAFNTSAWEEYAVNKTGPLTLARGNSLAFIPLPEVAPEKYLDLAKQVRIQKNTEYLPPIYKNNWRLLAGIREQRRVLANLFTNKKAAILELPVPASGAGVLVSLQKPLSRGVISIDPKNPQGAPKILYNAMTNPVDKSILAACVRYVRSVWSRPELAKFSPTELSPGAQLVTDEELIDTMVSKGSIWPTLAHPSGSCAMMPQVSKLSLLNCSKRLGLLAFSNLVAACPISYCSTASTISPSWMPQSCPSFRLNTFSRPCMLSAKRLHISLPAVDRLVCSRHLAFQSSQKLGCDDECDLPSERWPRAFSMPLTF